ncbi:MAG: hypothetical protein WBB07_24615 [Mycobacterium sp.]
MPVRLVCCAVAVLGLAAGCGTPETSPETTEPTPVSEHGSYAQCLTEHGVDQLPAPALGPAPGPAAPPPGVDAATWEQAVTACADFAPGPPGP